MSIKISRQDLMWAMHCIIEKMDNIDSTEGVIDLKLRVYNQDKNGNIVHEEVSCELCENKPGNWDIEEMQYMKDVRNWFGKSVKPLVRKSW